MNACNKFLLKNLDHYLSTAVKLAKIAGVELVKYWHDSPEKLDVKQKEDHTPATLADLAAHQILISGLQQLSPDLPVLSEEGEWPAFAERSQWESYWLIDPLDGTRGFIAHLPEFSINIALVCCNKPVLGIIYIPMSDTCYLAKEHQGAFKQIGDTILPIQTKMRPKLSQDPWRVLMGVYSRGVRVKELLKDRVVFELIQINGAIKFGWLAEGWGDIYPRFGPIHEWDTAAGQCILTEAGGTVVDLQGRPLQYNCKDSLLNPEFIALADASNLELWLNILNEQEK